MPTQYETCGYFESLHDKKLNKHIGSRTYTDLPEDRKVSVYGEIEITIPKGQVVKLRKGVKEIEWKSKGQVLISTFFPINGRIINKDTK